MPPYVESLLEAIGRYYSGQGGRQAMPAVRVLRVRSRLANLRARDAVVVCALDCVRSSLWILVFLVLSYPV